jgi:hypothetical protein
MASEDRGRALHGVGHPAAAGSASGSTGDQEGAADLAEQPDRSDAPEPRHLAITRRAPGPGLVRSVLYAGLLSLTVIAVGAAVVLQAVQRSGVPGLGVGKAPAVAAPPLTTGASTSRPPDSTDRPGRSLARRSVIDGSFEGGPAHTVTGVPSVDRPGTKCKRLLGGVNGGWALRLTATGDRPGPPGIWLDLTRTPTLGSRWHASVMVRGRPGVSAQFRLYERRDGKVVAADSARFLLRDYDWHQLVIRRSVLGQGTVLGVDLQLRGLAPGGTIALDDLTAVQLA